MTKHEAAVKACKELSLHASWNEYSKLIFAGLSVSQTQYDEMKKTFYASFFECLNIVADISSHLTEDEAAKKLDQLYNESVDYSKELVARFNAGRN